MREMTKIRKIQFVEHPILGNLSLDFCDADGKPVDTILIAGENGCGKSTVLEVLFSFASGHISSEASIEIEKDGKRIELTIYKSSHRAFWIRDSEGRNIVAAQDLIRENYQIAGIFSDVEINFTSGNPNSVTSMLLDSNSISQKSQINMPQQIKQLIIDIQALDDADVSRMLRENPDSTLRDLHIAERIPRFTDAFNRMFEQLQYSRIENRNGAKVILFKKNNVDIPIDDLSSGEKQIVYRGCFLLKDANALNGAFVFIDEPEISLHPVWQQKIMEYYKGIFTNEDGKQTSQIFAVTHSPFIIHNESRNNDKVIVLYRNEEGKIVASDKPEYYKCTSMEAVNDAFSINGFYPEKPFVYVEGRTDEKYYNRAIEVFDMNVPFQFKWVGHLDENGQEVNTGKDSLNKAIHFLVAQDLPEINICLFDCDSNKPTGKTGNVIFTSMDCYENDRGITVGIENALVFGDIDIEPFRKYKEKKDAYGMKITTPEFKKMACCEYICSLENEKLVTVFENIKQTIERLIKLYNGEEA